MSQRFASIDIGTNTVLLLVAELRPDGSFEAVEERMELTRLGRGVDERRLLDPQAVADTVSAVGSFTQVARDAGASKLVITATSAARDARNGSLLLAAIQAASGVTPEILPGEEEARLSYESARREFAPAAEALVVLDVGGGSTELIYGGGGVVHHARSLDLGAVRLTERWLRSDPPALDELASLRLELDEALATLPKPAPEARLVGVAGTVTTLCALHLGLDGYDGELVHGERLALQSIRALASKLASMPLAERLELPGLPPKRADVIVAGAELVLGVMESLGFSSVIVSDRGVRWGLLQDRFGRGSS